MYQSNSIKVIKSWGGMEGIEGGGREGTFATSTESVEDELTPRIWASVCVWVYLDISTLCVCVYCVWVRVCIYMWICSIYYLCMELQSCVEDALLFANCFAVSPFCICVYVCVCVCCVCGVCVCVCVWRREYLPPPQFCLFLALPQKRKKYILK